MKSAPLLLALGTIATFAAPSPVAFDWFEYTGRDPAFATPLAPGQFRNPILAGFYPDPSICRVPGKGASGADAYYLVNSTFAYFPGIPIFHSRDLVNWTQLGHVIDRSTQLDYDQVTVTHGLFAPTINWHDGTFYVLCTMVDGGGNFLVTATNPAGPWSDPIWLNFDGIDPSLCFADGRAWLVNNGNPPDDKPLYSGHRAIWIQEFDIAAKKLTGPRSIIVNGGADLAKNPSGSRARTSSNATAGIISAAPRAARAVRTRRSSCAAARPRGRSSRGKKNPILTQRDLDGTAPLVVTCTGHAELVVGPDGHWWSVFLGCRPFAGQYWTTGRETFLLPVTWTGDGWPMILSPGERVPYAVSAPKVGRVIPNAPPQDSLTAKDGGLGIIRPTTNFANTPLTGNFTWRDDFSAAPLSPLWLMLRAPKETWWSLDGCALRLTPRAEPLTGKGNPSFLARRLQHSRFAATTSLAAPIDNNVSAGLVAFQNETHYYYLGVRRTAESLSVFLERANGKTPELVASAKLSDVANLQLRLTNEEKIISFSYATTPGVWSTLVSGADVTPITVQAAGGGLHFTGTVLGLHARIEP